LYKKKEGTEQENGKKAKTIAEGTKEGRPEKGTLLRKKTSASGENGRILCKGRELVALVDCKSSFRVSKGKKGKKLLIAEEVKARSEDAKPAGKLTIVFCASRNIDCLRQEKREDPAQGGKGSIGGTASQGKKGNGDLGVRFPFPRQIRFSTTLKKGEEIPDERRKKRRPLPSKAQSETMRRGKGGEIHLRRGKRLFKASQKGNNFY